MDGAGERGEHRPFEGAEVLGEGAGHLGDGDESPCGGRGAGRGGGGDLLGVPAGDGPLQHRGIELGEEGEGEGDGDAVVVLAGIEAVAERHGRAVEGERLGEARGGEVGRLAEEHVGEREAEHPGVLRLGLLAPVVEGLAAVDAVGHAGVEEEGHGLVVGQHVAAAGAVAQAAHLLEEGPVVIDEGRLERVLLPDERVQDEEAPRGLGVDGPEVDAAIADDGEAVEGDVLPGHHLGRLLGPVGVRP